MKKPKCIWLLLMSILLTGASTSRDGRATKDIDFEVARFVSDISHTPVSEARSESARALNLFIAAKKPSDISNGTIDRIALLLREDDDSIRYWAASCLGHIGPSAKRAIPALLVALKERESMIGSLTSAMAIKNAIRSIGQNSEGQAKGTAPN